MDTYMDSAVDSVTNLPFLPSSAFSQANQDEVQKKAVALIQEIWEVVDQNFLDARNTGFSRDNWAKLRDVAISRQYNSMDAAYRGVRSMMVDGLRDPYSRFLTPQELNVMKKYDVTGVGLNLGTAKEYFDKVGKGLPVDRKAVDRAKGFLWTVHLLTVESLW
eukprot:gene29195-32406_t